MIKLKSILVCFIAVLLIYSLFSGCTNPLSGNGNNTSSQASDTFDSSEDSEASEISERESAGDTEAAAGSDTSEAKGNWTYYINKDDKYSIYKKNSDGSEKVKLSGDERVITLSVKDDYIYYTILDPNDGVTRLYKIKTDGSGRQAVCDVDFLGDVSQEEITASIKGNSIVFKVKPLGQPTDNATDKKKENSRIKNGTHTYEVSLDGNRKNDSQTGINAFFFNDSISEAAYSATFAFGEDVQKLEVTLSVKKIAELKDGKVYQLMLEPVKGVDEERLNLGYFCVQKNTIYKFDATQENLDTLKSTEQLPEGSVIVCQDKAIKDELDEAESGFHHYIDVNGNKREYHSYNNETETGFFEAFTWEKNKGLVGYRSGFGAENDLIELEAK